MSYIESSIRDALAKAAADTQSAQRGLALAAALLLLLHLLTVTPYVQVSSHLAGLEKDTAATMQLSEKLDAQKNQIEAAKKQASTDLGLTLNQATQEMIQSFAAVDDIIAGNSARIAVQGPSPRAYLPGSGHFTQISGAVSPG